VSTRSWQPFALQPIPLLRDDQHCEEVVRCDLVHRHVDAEFERTDQIECAPDYQPPVGCLDGIKLIERAVVAPGAIVGSVRAQAGLAQFLAPKRPVYEEPIRGVLRPFPF
jgi:hypothetical protein